MNYKIKNYSRFLLTCKHTTVWKQSHSLFVLILTFFVSSISFAQGFTTVDFHQAQNDRGGVKTYQIDWVNGILNSTHTDYWEGIGVPQRIVITGILANTQLPASQQNRHSLRFQVLAEKGGKHAYDFPISWDQAYKTAEDIGGSVNELQNLFTQRCFDAFSATGKTACGVLDAVTGNKVQTATFPDAIGNPGKPALGAPNVDARISCFETYVKPGQSGARYGDRTIEIRGNQDISNVSVTFNGYKGSGSDLAEYTLLWESSSDQVMIRFATRLAQGVGSCGYGIGMGAGSINGGPYHVTLERLDDRQNKAGVSMGSQDNQIMSNAVQIPPPTCGLSNGSSGCTNTATSFAVNYTSTEAAGAVVKFYFLSNTAGAKFASSTVTTVGSCSSNNVSVTADASGSASVSVVPTGSSFTAGSFRVGACVTGLGGSTSCEQTRATIIDEATVTATVNSTATTLASPYVINANQASPSATLAALAFLNGTQDNSLFSTFSWAVASGVVGNIAQASNLTNANTASATFVPTAKSPGPGYEPGLYAFDVTVTSTANGCQATTRVYISVTSGASCPSDIVGPDPVCAGSTGNVYSSASLAAKSTYPEPGLTYTWSIVQSGGSTNAVITSTAVNVTQVTVTAGDANFAVRVTVTNANGEVFYNSGCEKTVTVNPIPSCTISGPDPVCGGSTGNTYTSTLDPTGGTVVHSWSITGSGTIVGATNGASISVTAGASGTYTVTDNITRNGCASSCTKTVTIDPAPSVAAIYNPPACDENTFTVDVVSPTNGWTYSIDQPGNSDDFSGQDHLETAGEAIRFTGLKAGDGFIITVTTGLARCTATTNCGSSTNSCTTPSTPGATTNSSIVQPVEETSAKKPDGRIVETYKIALGATTKVVAVPNPYSDKIRFNLVSSVSGTGSLELYNVLGQMVGTVYQGYVQAGRELIKEYIVPLNKRSTLLYVFKVGDQKVTGKLIGRK